MRKKIIVAFVLLLTVSALVYGIYRGEVGETFFKGAVL